MLSVELKGDRIHIGPRFSVAFQRTLRIPGDGGSYPLPPGFGPFPIHRVEDFSDGVPASWRQRGGYFISMYQREAFWIALSGAPWKPNAVKVGVGQVNVLSGEPFDDVLRDEPQDYLVCPKQLWLDGINAAAGHVKQFVAMPLGAGYTMEGQLTGKEEFGGVEIIVFEPKPGRFPDSPPPANPALANPMYAIGLQSAEMGVGVGGRIQQKIYPDPFGTDTWDPANRGSALIHIVNSQQYAALTGHGPPLTPISAETYIERGLPWFELYDEGEGDITQSERLAGLKSIEEIDSEESRLPRKSHTTEVPKSSIKKIRGPDLV